jgi:hypothetical protein
MTASPAAPLPTPGVADWAKEKGEEKAKVNYLNKALDLQVKADEADEYDPVYTSDAARERGRTDLDSEAADLSKQAKLLKERADAYKTAGRRRSRRRGRKSRRGSRRA